MSKTQQIYHGLTACWNNKTLIEISGNVESVPIDAINEFLLKELGGFQLEKWLKFQNFIPIMSQPEDKEIVIGRTDSQKLIQNRKIQNFAQREHIHAQNEFLDLLRHIIRVNVTFLVNLEDDSVDPKKVPIEILNLNGDQNALLRKDMNSFRRVLKLAQGLEPIDSKIMTQLCYELDEFFCKNSYPPSSVIKKEPLNSNGTRGSSNFAMIALALSALERESLKNYTNYLCSIYWNWEIPCFRFIEETLIEMHRTILLHRIQKQLTRLKIDNWVFLWLHLQQCSIVPDENFFMLPCENDIQIQKACFTELSSN